MEDYEYVATLGEGAYGFVWKCVERATGRLVAIKGFKQAHEEPEIMRLAVREARVLQTLKHPAIVSLIEAFKSKSGRVYMVFPYVGPSVFQDLDKHPDGFPDSRLKPLVWQLLQALVYLHKRKVIHRDIKPGNILLSDDGGLKLCDFGFARTTHCGPRDVEHLTSYVVTRWYRAPELLVGEHYGPSSDIWSLGCTIAEMASGVPLFPGKSTGEQLWRIMRCFGSLPAPQMALMSSNRRLARVRVPVRGRSLRDRLRYCDPELQQLVEACLQLDPRHRPTASELLQSSYLNGVSRMLVGTPLEHAYSGMLQQQKGDEGAKEQQHLQRQQLPAFYNKSLHYQGCENQWPCAYKGQEARLCSEPISAAMSAGTSPAFCQQCESPISMKAPHRENLRRYSPPFREGEQQMQQKDISRKQDEEQEEISNSSLVPIISGDLKVNRMGARMLSNDCGEAVEEWERDELENDPSLEQPRAVRDPSGLPNTPSTMGMMRDGHSVRCVATKLLQVKEAVSRDLSTAMSAMFTVQMPEEGMAGRSEGRNFLHMTSNAATGTTPSPANPPTPQQYLPPLLSEQYCRRGSSDANNSATCVIPGEIEPSAFSTVPAAATSVVGSRQNVPCRTFPVSPFILSTVGNGTLQLVDPYVATENAQPPLDHYTSAALNTPFASNADAMLLSTLNLSGGLALCDTSAFAHCFRMQPDDAARMHAGPLAPNPCSNVNQASDGHTVDLASTLPGNMIVTDISIIKSYPHFLHPTQGTGRDKHDEMLGSLVSAPLAAEIPCETETGTLMLHVSDPAISPIEDGDSTEASTSADAAFAPVAPPLRNSGYTSFVGNNNLLVSKSMVCDKADAPLRPQALLRCASLLRSEQQQTTPGPWKPRGQCGSQLLMRSADIQVTATGHRELQSRNINGLPAPLHVSSEPQQQHQIPLMLALARQSGSKAFPQHQDSSTGTEQRHGFARGYSSQMQEGASTEAGELSSKSHGPASGVIIHAWKEVVMEEPPETTEIGGATGVANQPSSCRAVTGIRVAEADIGSMAWGPDSGPGGVSRSGWFAASGRIVPCRSAVTPNNRSRLLSITSNVACNTPESPILALRVTDVVDPMALPSSSLLPLSPRNTAGPALKSSFKSSLDAVASVENSGICASVSAPWSPAVLPCIRRVTTEEYDGIAVEGFSYIRKPGKRKGTLTKLLCAVKKAFSAVSRKS